MLAYVRDICGQCGNLRSVCSNPELAVYPQRTMCYVTAVAEMTERQVHKRFGRPDEKTDGLHPTDGMRVWASPEDVNPNDDFLSPQQQVGDATEAAEDRHDPH